MMMMHRGEKTKNTSFRAGDNRAKISISRVPSREKITLGIGISRFELLLEEFDSPLDPAKGNPPAECTILRYMVCVLLL